MKHFSGPLDGYLFAADKPLVVLGWPKLADIAEFDTLTEADQFIDQARRDSEAANVLARFYEFQEDHWQRLPLVATQLARWESTIHHHKKKPP